MGVVCKQYGIMAELGVADACNVPTAVVFQQCNDIVLLQKDTIANLQHRVLAEVLSELSINGCFFSPLKVVGTDW